MDLSFLPDWPPAFSPALAVAALALVASAAGEIAARWLHLPRMLGYLAAGAVFGAGGHLVEWLNLQPLPAPTLYGALDFAASFILFDLGQRVSFGWLRRNPALLGASVVEAGVTFVAVFVAMRMLDIAPLPAALIATISMSTSPAVVLALTREVRAQGQVTERILLLTALNSIYAVLFSTLLLAWARLDTRGLLDDYLLHPAYLVFGSLAIAALGARLFHWVAGFVHHERAVQLILMLAIISIVFTLSSALRLSPLLALLACGAFVRAFDHGRRMASSDVGLISALALVLFFALSAATVEWQSAARRRRSRTDAGAGPDLLQDCGRRGTRTIDWDRLAQRRICRHRSAADVRNRADADAPGDGDEPQARRAGGRGGSGERRRVPGRRCTGAAVRIAGERRSEGTVMSNDPLEFKKSALLTMGTELELQLVERRSGDLTRAASDLIALVTRKPFPGDIKPEITESMLEVSTDVHTAYLPLRDQLTSDA